MKTVVSRREFAGLLGLAATWPLARNLVASDDQINFRVRTITAGLQLQSPTKLEPARDAVAFLELRQKSLKSVLKYVLTEH